jgi:hypothetical protein
MEHLTHIVIIGMGATVIMDIWFLLLKQLKIPTMNIVFLGRWVGHLFHGTFAHDAIGKAATVKHELLLGWLAHYAIGIAFAALLILLAGPDWTRHPTFITALTAGIATVVAPLFILQPAMGSGFASSKTPAPLFNCIKSLANHAMFGAGLYIAAVSISAVLPTSH